jgi:iron complex outermembrane receptor protein
MLKHLLLGSAALATLTAHHALAQGPTEGSTQPATGGFAGALEEIVVTARRREESAQTVPVSIKAFSQEELDRRSVSSLEDLTRVTPGLRFTSEGGPGSTQISLRGLTKIPVGAGTPAVVTYFSDVPLPTDGTNIPTFDLANVQVLKGPQGTLFGKNTIGGAVLVVPAAPSYQTEGYAKISYGNYDYTLVEGAINLPLVDDRLALRLSGQSRDRDPFQANRGPGPDQDNLDQYSLRASLLWEPTDALSNTTIVDYFEGDENPGNLVLYNYTPGILSAGFGPLFAPFEQSLAAAAAEARAAGPRRTNSGLANGYYKRELWGVTNTTAFEFNEGLTLRNIFGFRSTLMSYFADTFGGPVLQADSTAVDAAALGIPVPPGLAFVDQLILLHPGTITDRRQYSNEIQLLGNSSDGKWDWIVGGFYSLEEPSGKQGDFFKQFDPIISALGAELNPAKAATSHTEIESKAVFAQIGYDLSEMLLSGLKLNLGARYTWDEIDACGAGIIAPVSPASPEEAPFFDYDDCKALAGISPSDGNGTLTTESKAPTWTVGLDYQVNDDTFLYVVTRRGYRSAGVNTPAFETPCTTGPCATPPFGGIDIRTYQYVDKETVTDVEVGAKLNFSLGDMAGRLNISAFDMSYEDAVQFLNVANSVSDDGGQPNRGSIGINAANLTIRGFEAEFIVTPLSGLTLSATTAYIDQEVDDIANIQPPLPPLSARQVTLPTSRWSGTLSGSYALPLSGDGELVFSGDYYWTDEFQAQGAPIPSYEVANFRLDWLGIAGSGFNVGAFITNAFQEEYILAASVNLPQFPWNSGTFGQPRMYGMDFSYRF